MKLQSIISDKQGDFAACSHLSLHPLSVDYILIGQLI